jgi:hypothetical protein
VINVCVCVSVALRSENIKLKQQSALIGADDLLRDYDEREVCDACLSLFGDAMICHWALSAALKHKRRLRTPDPSLCLCCSVSFTYIALAATHRSDRRAACHYASSIRLSQGENSGVAGHGERNGGRCTGACVCSAVTTDGLTIALREACSPNRLERSILCDQKPSVDVISLSWSLHTSPHSVAGSRAPRLYSSVALCW